MRDELKYFITDSEICYGPVMAVWCNYSADELYAYEEENGDWPEDYAMLQLMDNGFVWVIINNKNFEYDFDYLEEAIDNLKKYGYTV